LTWLPDFLYCPVCTAVTPTTVNGASQLHNSESVSASTIVNTPQSCMWKL